MMDAFLQRGKKRKSENAGPADPLRLRSEPPIIDEDGDESTDVKLAMLSSLFPKVGQDALMEALLVHEGSVEAATLVLKDQPLAGLSKKLRGGNGVIGSQTSLRHFASPRQATGSDAHDMELTPTPKKPKLLAKKGTTLHLFDPEDVAAQTPCSIVHNFLPADVADDLLREMLDESSTFERISFKLFENVVQSPHTSTFYVETDEELNTQKHEYFYNGARLEDVRRITPQLLRVKPLVQKGVNHEIQKRIQAQHPDGKKLRFQSPDPWSPNVAFVNCYDGPQESVGWHSDQLTYLGPRAIIGSLSLGVAREFRVRRVMPRDVNSDNKRMAENQDMEGQIAIHLPHNSLLVMHAEMQEQWKHSISPANAIDPHPIAGSRRINVTYRDYRAGFHPKFTPRCQCGIPAVLKVVQKRKENFGKYFWMCYGSYIPGKENCTFFQWGDFDDDGNPSWDRERYRKGLGRLDSG